ncbi:winged helix DNA-binding domain-containing protein [Thermohalobacter berrensis]|uniref:winged helix DNA-binding domain-containing protein n=1 Tax=Thermohalobacter berrensis TaxID=99594 RepID=UPI00242A9BBE|nr:winged helix DNA-binding domain-containing protein [Thermohalobacter berrensis]
MRKVGCIQFDPLNRVGQNPDLVLQSRIKDYKPTLLQELLYTDRKLLDGWDKNMSIYSIEDWPYFERYRMNAYKKYKRKSKDLNKILPEVRKVLKEKGPLSSIDLKFDTKIDWAWAPTRVSRAALESMYSWGELIVHHKVGTRKYYDFTEKYLPDNLLSTPDPNTSDKEYYKWHIKRRIRGIGMLWALSGGSWLGIKGLKKGIRTEILSELVKNDEVILIKVENIENPFYILKEDEELLHRVLNGVCIEPQVSFIAPLDNILWDRKLVKKIFDFEYVWEVYKPVKERKYGYYVLPILYGDKFIGRFEPVLDKKSNQLVIKNWWWEPEVSITDNLHYALISALKDFLNYLGADKVKISNNKNFPSIL